MRLSASFSVSMLVIMSAIIFAQNPGTLRTEIEQHTRLAQQYLQEKRPDLALPEFQKLASLEPDNADVRGNLGVLLYFQGDYRPAIPQLRAALRLNSHLAKIQALLGLAEEKTGDRSAALKDLSTAFPILDDTKVKKEVGSVLVAEYSRSGDLSDGIAVTGALLRDDPTNINLLYTQYRLSSDLTDQAILTLALVSPESAQMHQLMAHELYRRDDIPAALANYKEALKLDPNLPGLHFEMAELMYNSNDPALQAQAENEYKLALTQDPDNEKALTRLSAILLQQGNAQQAQHYIAKALVLDPNDEDAMLAQSQLSLANNKPEEAETMLKKILAADPTNYIAHYRLSTLYRQQGQPEKAQKELAEYQKYKAMKERLRKIFDAMRLLNKNVPSDRETGGMSAR